MLLGELLLPYVVQMMGAEGAIFENCILYGRILLLTMPAFMLQYLFQTFLVAAEKPRLGLLFTIGSGMINIILDAIFVGVLDWGFAGAAGATQ